MLLWPAQHYVAVSAIWLAIGKLEDWQLHAAKMQRSLSSGKGRRPAPLHYIVYALLVLGVAELQQAHLFQPLLEPAGLQRTDARLWPRTVTDETTARI